MIKCSPWVKLTYGESLVGEVGETIYLVHQRNGKSLVVGTKQEAMFKAPQGLKLTSLEEYQNIYGITDSDIQELQQEIDAMGMGVGQKQCNSCKSSEVDHLVTRKIPLFSPDRYLSKNKWIYAWFLSIPAFVAWGVLWGIALWSITGQWHSFFTAYKDYSYQNIPVIIIATIVAKIIHEFSHAFAIKTAGGRVGSLGIMLIGFMPLPYTEGKLLHHANKGERVRIALAGIYGESWLAAIALLLWTGLPEGAFKTACHFIVVVSFGITLVANLLPVMKFDGYQTISGALRNPLLYEDAIAHFRSFAYKVIGLASNDQTLEDRKAVKRWLPFYGASIFAWRIILPVSLMYGFAVLEASYLGYEPLLIFTFSILIARTMWLKPALREKTKLVAAYGQQGFAATGIFGLLAIIALLAWLIAPLPHVQSAPMAIKSHAIPVVINKSGIITSVKPAGWINKGETIAVAHDQSLGVDISANRALANEISARIGNVREDQALVREELSMIELNQNELLGRKQKQIIAAVQDGYWEPKKLRDLYQQGMAIGRIIQTKKPRVIDVFMTPAQNARLLANEDYESYSLELKISAVTLDKRSLDGLIQFGSSLVLNTKSNQAMVDAGLLKDTQNGSTLAYSRYTGTIDIHGPDAFGYAYFSSTYSIALEFAKRWIAKATTFNI